VEGVEGEGRRGVGVEVFHSRDHAKETRGDMVAAARSKPSREVSRASAVAVEASGVSWPISASRGITGVIAGAIASGRCGDGSADAA
jgi:hypothetical protein